MFILHSVSKNTFRIQFNGQPLPFRCPLTWQPVSQQFPRLVQVDQCLADLLAKAGSPALCAEELSPRPEPIVTLGHTEYRERGARRREGTGIPIIWDRLLSK